MSVMFLKHWAGWLQVWRRNICQECECGCFEHTKKLKGRFTAHKLSTEWAAGVVKSVEKKKNVDDQFAVKYKEDYGVDKYFLLL